MGQKFITMEMTRDVINRHESQKDIVKMLCAVTMGLCAFVTHDN